MCAHRVHPLRVHHQQVRTAAAITDLARQAAAAATIDPARQAADPTRRVAAITEAAVRHREVPRQAQAVAAAIAAEAVQAEAPVAAVAPVLAVVTAPAAAVRVAVEEDNHRLMTIV